VESCGLNLSSLGQGPMADCYEHGNGPLGSIKDRKFLESLSDS